jgi:hypothetical protein
MRAEVLAQGSVSAATLETSAISTKLPLTHNYLNGFACGKHVARGTKLVDEKG